MTKRILVVEDNPQNLYLAEFLLRHNGYAVLSARTGKEALSIAAAEVPDMILMDIQLPEMDGFATIKEIRKCPALRHIPIVAVTSYAMIGDREKAIAAGCEGYIEKPYEPGALLAEIDRLFRELASNAGGGKK
jgi:two-component system cell cycle response regulator DivK